MLGGQKEHKIASRFNHELNDDLYLVTTTTPRTDHTTRLNTTAAAGDTLPGSRVPRRYHVLTLD